MTARGPRGVVAPLRIAQVAPVAGPLKKPLKLPVPLPCTVLIWSVS